MSLNDHSLFEMNCQKLRSKNPSLALMLALSPSSSLAQPLEEGPYYKQLSSLNVDRLFLFAPSLQPALKELLKWLDQKQSRDLIVLENDLSLLKSFMSTSIAKELLSHPRVHVFWTELFDFWNQNKKKIEYFLTQSFHITSPPSAKHRKEEFENIKEAITSLAIDLNVYCAEYLQTSPLVYQNVLENFFSLTGAKHITSFKEAFKGVPALICAAGSSLNEQASEIKHFKSKGLVFAGGRAQSVLSDLGIEPHFGLGIDPYDQHASTLRCNSFFQTPFIFRSRMNKDALHLIHGEKIYVPSAIGYSFVQWLENQLFILSLPFEEGLNVVNFNLEMARYLGCDPLILVGCDLAYQNDQAYSPSIPDEQALPLFNSIEEDDFSLHRGYFLPGNQGVPVFSLWKWMEEAKWISSFAQKHAHLTLYNTSLKGLWIEHTQLKNLSEILRSLKKPSVNFSDQIHSQLQKAPAIQIDPAQFLSTLTFFLKSIQNALDLLKQLLQAPCEKSAFIKELLLQEVAYHHLLVPLEELFMRLDPLHLQKDCSTRKALFLIKKLEEYKEVFLSFRQANF